MGEENEGRSIGVDLHPNRFNTAEIGLESGKVQRERWDGDIRKPPTDDGCGSGRGDHEYIRVRSIV
jgi:hypothetical protein